MYSLHGLLRLLTERQKPGIMPLLNFLMTRPVFGIVTPLCGFALRGKLRMGVAA